jgi:hypothetical protein
MTDTGQHGRTRTDTDRHGQNKWRAWPGLRGFAMTGETVGTVAGILCRPYRAWESGGMNYTQGVASLALGWFILPLQGGR